MTTVPFILIVIAACLPVGAIITVVIALHKITSEKIESLHTITKEKFEDLEKRLDREAQLLKENTNAAETRLDARVNKLDSFLLGKHAP